MKGAGGPLASTEEVDHVGDHVGRVGNDVEALQTWCGHVEREMDEMRARGVSNLSYISRVEGDVGNVRTEVSTLEGAVKKRFDRVEGDVESLKRGAATSAHDMTEVKKRNVRVETQVEDNRRQINAQVDSVEAEVGNVKTEVGTLEGAVKKRFDRVEGDVESLKRGAATSAHDMTEVKKRNVRVEKQVESIHRQINAQVDSVAKEVANVRDQAENGTRGVNERVDDVEHAFRQMRGQLQLMEEKLHAIGPSNDHNSHPNNQRTDQKGKKATLFSRLWPWK